MIKRITSKIYQWISLLQIKDACRLSKHLSGMHTTTKNL